MKPTKVTQNSSKDQSIFDIFIHLDTTIAHGQIYPVVITIVCSHSYSLYAIRDTFLCVLYFTTGYLEDGIGKYAMSQYLLALIVNGEYVKTCHWWCVDELERVRDIRFLGIIHFITCRIDQGDRFRREYCLRSIIMIYLLHSFFYV